MRSHTDASARARAPAQLLAAACAALLAACASVQPTQQLPAPGEGGIDLAALFARLPADLPISVEIPNDRRAPLIGAEAWTREVMASARGFFAGLGRNRT